MEPMQPHPQQHVLNGNSATSEYFAVIRRHVILPLDNSSVANHCFAAAMLIFAGIDGLGRLIHPNASAGPGERFRAFLPRLGGDYRLRQNELWDLRNALDHNAINVACYMSRTEDARGQHLEIITGIFSYIPSGCWRTSK
jgi:hypothetical protein